MSIRESESRFINNYRNKIFSNFNLFFWLDRLREGAKTPEGALYWMRCILTLNSFVSKKNKDPLIYAFVVPIWAKDPMIKRNYGGPTMPLEQAQKELLQEDEIEEEEHLLIAQLRARRKRSDPSESIVPVAVMDPKGKAVEVPTSKPQRKRKKSKPQSR